MINLFLTINLLPIFLVKSFVRPAGPTDQKTQNMQNKPNLCLFRAVRGDCEEKQTQTNPIQTQNKAIFNPPANPQTQNKPNQTQTNPASLVNICLFFWKGKTPGLFAIAGIIEFFPESFSGTALRAAGQAGLQFSSFFGRL